MEVVEDLVEGPRRFSAARGDAGGWPTWGEARGCYAVWVDQEAELASLLVLDSESGLTVADARVAVAVQVDEIDLDPGRPWPDGDPGRRIVLLCVWLLRDGTWSAGFGPLGAPARRRRPIQELIGFAHDGLSAAG